MGRIIDLLTIYIFIALSGIDFGQSSFSPVTIDFSGGSLSPFVQSSRSNFDWSLADRTTPSTGTGPTKGHTPCTGTYSYCSTYSADYYAYIETSSPQSYGDEAIMYYPADVSASSCIKVDFWFHGRGSDLASLSVVSGNDGVGWSYVSTVSTTSQVNWRQHTATITSTNANMRVGFRGMRGNGYKGDYAIDDITISDCNYVAPTTSTTTMSPDQTTPHQRINGDGSYFSYYTHGSIYGANYPDGYDSGTKCVSKYWVILAKPNQRIVVDIEVLDLYYADEFTLIDLTTFYGTQIYESSGKVYNLEKTTDTHHLNISFKCGNVYSRYRIISDYRGFHVDWRLTDENGNSVTETSEAPGSDMPTSSATITGIAVGCVAAVLLIAIIIASYFCCCKKKKQSGRVLDTQPYTTAGGAYPAANYGRPAATASSGYAQQTSHVVTTNQSYTNQAYASYPNQGYAPPAYNTAPPQQGAPMTGYNPPPQGYNQANTAAPPAGFNGYNVQPVGASQNTNATPQQGAPTTGYSQANTTAPPAGYNGYNVQPVGASQNTNATPQQGAPTTGYSQANTTAPPAGYNGYNVPPVGANQNTNTAPVAQTSYGNQVENDNRPASSGMPPVEGVAALPPPPAYETVGSYDFGATPSAPAVYETPYQMPKTD